MSSSHPPPAASTLRSFLRRSAEISRLVAAALVGTVAVQFTIVSIRHALDSTHASTALHDAARSGSATPAPSHPLPSAVSASASAAPAVRSFRLTLGVTAGPPRSEVYVNGRLLGQTPFFGDMACKSTLPIHIDVVPPTGAPMAYVRSCVPGTLEITGPPP